LTPPDAGEVLKVEDWAEIRRLHRAEGVPIKEIARRLGVARSAHLSRSSSRRSHSSPRPIPSRRSWSGKVGRARRDTTAHDGRRLRPSSPRACALMYDDTRARARPSPRCLSITQARSLGGSRAAAAVGPGCSRS